jgi:hypothetical protein
VDDFILWYKFMQIQTRKNTNQRETLRLNFEDLVMNYDNSRDSIFKFLEIDAIQHKYPMSNFDPKKSKKNVQLWKRQNNNDIKVIEENLSEFCMF